MTYRKPEESGRTIQTRLHPQGGETEENAIYVWDTRRLKGEQARDIIALALSELGTEGKPARFDDGTANWFLDRIYEAQEEFVEIMMGKMAEMLSNIKTLADSSGDSTVHYDDVERELSEFEKNMKKTSQARRQSFKL